MRAVFGRDFKRYKHAPLCQGSALLQRRARVRKRAAKEHEAKAGGKVRIALQVGAEPVRCIVHGRRDI